mmetsp:Transcript_3185/g.4636  ORF Transcript_3185/g.4636 Transcript_3185/m.4636 type:complete len:207 (+) Transcript_3185:124-744(+)
MAAADLTSLFNSSRIKSRSFRTLRLERHPGSSSILNSCWSIANPFPSCPRSRWQVPNCTMRYFLLLFFRSSISSFRLCAIAMITSYEYSQSSAWTARRNVRSGSHRLPPLVSFAVRCLYCEPANHHVHTSSYFGAYVTSRYSLKSMSADLSVTNSDSSSFELYAFIGPCLSLASSTTVPSTTPIFANLTLPNMPSRIRVDNHSVLR